MLELGEDGASARAAYRVAGAADPAFEAALRAELSSLDADAASTALSETISKELKRRGFKFVGPTIVYAWMQAVGIVDDHTAGCFRHGRPGRPAK